MIPFAKEQNVQKPNLKKAWLVFLVLVQHWRFSVCKLAVHLCHTEEERFRAIGMTVRLPKEMIQGDGPREYHHGNITTGWMHRRIGRLRVPIQYREFYVRWLWIDDWHDAVESTWIMVRIQKNTGKGVRSDEASSLSNDRTRLIRDGGLVRAIMIRVPSLLS